MISRYLPVEFEEDNTDPAVVSTNTTGKIMAGSLQTNIIIMIFIIIM